MRRNLRREARNRRLRPRRRRQRVKRRPAPLRRRQGRGVAVDRRERRRRRVVRRPRVPESQATAGRGGRCAHRADRRRRGVPGRPTGRERRLHPPQRAQAADEAGSQLIRLGLGRRGPCSFGVQRPRHGYGCGHRRAAVVGPGAEPTAAPGAAPVSAHRRRKQRPSPRLRCPGPQPGLVDGNSRGAAATLASLGRCPVRAAARLRCRQGYRRSRGCRHDSRCRRRTRAERGRRRRGDYPRKRRAVGRKSPGRAGCAPGGR